MRVCTKKLISLTIAFVMLFTLLPFSASADEADLTKERLCEIVVETFGLTYDDSMTEPYADIEPDDACYYNVCICYSKGVITKDDNFNASNKCERKYVAEVLYKCGLRVQGDYKTPSDPDIDRNVIAVVDAGAMKVDADNYFYPNDIAKESDIFTGAISTYISKYMSVNTTTGLSFDLSTGSISVKRNIVGVLEWTQENNESHYRTANGFYAAISQDANTTTNNTITVTDSTVELTIDSLNISVASSPMKVVKNSSVVLKLVGNNTFKASGSGETAGVLVVTSALTINGIGSLTATGGMYSAGIGGGNGGDCGTVTIESGTVRAIGGKYAAGIGGGKGGAGGTVTINGGVVTATGGDGVAAIGAGQGGTAGTLNISGGTVNGETHAANTITFNSNGGSEVVPITAQAEEPISEPEAPTKAGHYFAGWFKDTACTAQAFDFTTMPDESLTPLYAKWMENGTQRGIEYSVSLSVGNETAIPNGDFTVTASIGVLEGGTAGSDILVLAVYDASGRMIENHCVNFSSTTGKTNDVPVHVANSGGAAARIKAFILPRYGPTAPLAAAASFPAAGI